MMRLCLVVLRRQLVVACSLCLRCSSRVRARRCGVNVANGNVLANLSGMCDTFLYLLLQFGVVECFWVVLQVIAQSFDLAGLGAGLDDGMGGSNNAGDGRVLNVLVVVSSSSSMMLLVVSSSMMLVVVSSSSSMMLVVVSSSSSSSR